MLDPIHTSRFSRLFELCLCLLLVSVSACKLNEKASVAGGLVVAVDTDMTMPKDLDQLRVEVTQGTSTLLMHEQMLAVGTAALPLEFEVKDAQDGVPVLVRAIGLKDGAPRVERSAITTVPTTYLGLVRLQLNYLCDGMVSADGLSSCGASMTCVQGACDTAAIANSLPDYYERDAATSSDGTGMTANAMSSCFDVAKCLGDRTEMMPDTANGCSFESYKLYPTNLNVALQLDQGSAGVCDKTGCLIVLDSDGGFNVGNDARVYLPQTVCQLRDEGANIHIAVSTQCPSKTQGTPLCRGGANSPSSSDPSKGITVGTSNPVGGACAGGGARACEMCGSQNRMCQSGLWSEFGMCGDQGVCQPDTIESCGANGTRTCGGDCTWGNCENQTCDGASTRACGNCGTQHRSCSNGAWTEWSACGGEGMCMPGSTQECGSGGTQACEGSCAWSACTMQVCVGAASGACGNCGTHTRTCDPNTAQWSDWGPCEDEGECRPDSTMACGRDGTQTCGGNCQWDVACTGQSCEGPARRACGLCGTQIRTCDMTTGQYSDWSECFAEGECEPDSRTSCGSGGERTCGGNCRWGLACTGQTCDGPSTQACGDCGTQTRRCDTNTGIWTDWSSCLNEGECSPLDTRTCGASGTQTCNNSCHWGTACPGQTCTGPSVQPCPNNPCAMQTRQCDTTMGKWGAWTACPNGCDPGETQTGTCTGGKLQTCDRTCAWDACACPVGKTTCNGGPTCLDTMTDTNHCGGCNMPCLKGQDCKNGVCECPLGTMLCKGQCVSVATDENNCGGCDISCSGNAFCKSGTCDCPSNGGTPQTYCNGSCVNLATDKNNCGACANACGPGLMCLGGNCVCPPGTMDCDPTPRTSCINVMGTDEKNCGDCGMACAAGQICMGGKCETQCPAGEMQCGNSCADLSSDPQHCGTCGNACMDKMTCRAGKCQCPAGSDQCGGTGTACVPLNTSTHCGDCATACEGGGMCTGGMCGCRAGMDMCDGQCVDLKTSRAHCGSCTNACPSNATCTAGTCDCPNGTMDCGGSTCVNIMTDPSNCGDCGKKCGTTCNNGQCGCGANQHMCTSGCVTRSAQSCGPTCDRCPTRANATAECSSGDECKYTCTGGRPTCGEQCCGAGEMCVGGSTCRAVMTPPPDGGTGGPNTPPNGGTGGPNTPPNGGTGGPNTPPNGGTGGPNTPPNGGTGGPTTPPNGGTGGRTTPPNGGTGGRTTPPNGGTGGPTTPPNGGTGGPTTPPNGGTGGPTTPPTGGTGTTPTAGRTGGPRGGTGGPRTPEAGRGGPTTPTTPRGGAGGGRASDDAAAA